MAPNSPDLNAVDYKICGIIEQRVYEMQSHNVDELDQRLVDVWSGLQQSVVDAAVSEWRKRLQVCVCSRDGRTLPTSAVGCFDNGMKLSTDCSLCTTCC